MPVTKMPNRFLDRIKKPNDIKEIDKTNLKNLAAELRDILISNVSNNGGHLASNLGVVELTISLLRAFDFETDKIIWDVGHQSYTYKILTGRMGSFNAIRKKNGLSGFPKRDESNYDHFNTGHSSTSVSAALGYARAFKIKGIDSYSIAVIGDGAMTGGMAFEALNDAGASGEKIIVVLNDNEMSITKNVGGFAEYFSRMRSSRLYSDANYSVKKGIEKVPLIGKLVSKGIHKAKSAVKYLFSENMLFEEMGFHYLGPVDGHDVNKLLKILNGAKKINGPVLIHAVTLKGKGYRKAEEKPDIYHGVGKFDVIKGFEEKENDTFSSLLGSYLTGMASNDNDITVICPAVTLGCGLVGFSQKFPNRFFDVGIAEQHAVTMAAGMSCGGMKPIVAGYSTFMQRAYDQMLHDVCLMNLHVVFTFDRAGIVDKDGATHQGVYDLSYLSNMPNLRIYAPSDFRGLQKYLNTALYYENGPVVIRYPKGKINIPDYKIEVEPGKSRLLKSGKDCTIFSYGKMLEESLKAAKILDEKGIECSIVDLGCIKPIDMDGVIRFSRGKKVTACIEDVVISGSCSMQISAHLSQELGETKFYSFTLGENFNSEGDASEILHDAGLSGEQVAESLLSVLK